MNYKNVQKEQRGLKAKSVSLAAHKADIATRGNRTFTHKGEEVVFEYIGTANGWDTEAINEMLWKYNDDSIKAYSQIVAEGYNQFSIYVYAYEKMSGYVVSDERGSG